MRVSWHPKWRHSTQNCTISWQSVIWLDIFIWFVNLIFFKPLEEKRKQTMDFVEILISVGTKANILWFFFYVSHLFTLSLSIFISFWLYHTVIIVLENEQIILSNFHALWLEIVKVSETERNSSDIIRNSWKKRDGCLYYNLNLMAVINYTSF